MITQVDLLDETIAKLGARHVMTVDADNVVLAWRDTGRFQGVPFDKYRVAPWYWSNRNGQWQQGSGSFAVPYERKYDLLTGMCGVASFEAMRNGVADQLKAAVIAVVQRLSLQSRNNL
jgi:hypothetical protein